MWPISAARETGEVAADPVLTAEAAGMSVVIATATGSLPQPIGAADEIAEAVEVGWARSVGGERRGCCEEALLLEMVAGKSRSAPSSRLACVAPFCELFVQDALT